MAVGLFFQSLSLLLFELLLTRIFAIVLFSQFAHVAISLALLGIGIGATALHVWPGIVPADKLRGRLGHLALAQAALTIGAVALTLALPFTPSMEEGMHTRSAVWALRKRALLSGGFFRTEYLALLVPVIAAPFVCAGIAFGAAFRHGRAEIGRLYAADLCGGAVGCLLFIPVLGVVGGPDGSLAAGAAAAVAALGYYGATWPRARVAAGAAAVVLLALVGVAARADLLRVRHPAGFDERRVEYALWTPLARLAVWNDGKITEVLLDNASRAELALDREVSLRRHGDDPFTLVYKTRPPGRVLVIGAGGGYEVHVANQHGFTDITAVEIAGGIFDIMRERYRDRPDNPYLDPRVKTVVGDGRSVVKQASGRFDVIGMLQPFHLSFGGALAEAWSHRLLTTREAWNDYLDKLDDDGVVFYSALHDFAIQPVASAYMALRDRGVRDPARHVVAYGRDPGYATLVLKRKPFSAAELEAIAEVAARDRYRLFLFPGRKAAPSWKREFAPGRRLLTDDHPYLDSPATMKGAIAGLGAQGARNEIQLLHQLLLILLGMLLVAGLVFIGGPFLARGRREIARLPGVGWALAFAACLGYAYLAIEIVLVHKLVLFVGHPTYAVTLVLLVLLLCSGGGSLLAQRIAPERLAAALRWALAAVLLLGIVQTYAFAPLASRHLLGLPLEARVVITGLALAPLGFAMGMPFPLAMRLLPAAAAETVPWCWAINGWTSVLAATVAMLLARLYSYGTALAVALAVYALALAIAPRLARVGEPG